MYPLSTNVSKVTRIQELGGTTVTTSLTIAAGTKTTLFVFAYRASGGITGVTYNGVAMTSFTDASGGTAWRLNAPATGTHNIVVTGAANTSIGSYAGIEAIAIDNVDQTTPVLSMSGNGGCGTSAGQYVQRITLTTTGRNVWALRGMFWGGVKSNLDTTSSPFCYGVVAGNFLSFGSVVATDQAAANCGATGFLQCTGATLYSYPIASGSVSSDYKYGAYFTDFCGGGGVSIDGSTLVFVNEALPNPTATTTAASGILFTSAFMNATVNGNGYATNTYIEYGTSPGVYGTSLPTVATGTGSASYSQQATGLTTGTTYYYRVVATNANGTSYGSELTVVPQEVPAVVTSAVSSLTNTTVTLNGTVNSKGLATNYYFEYGPTLSFGSTTSVTANGTGTTAQARAESISGLTPLTGYFYRLVATNAVGTTYGDTLSFVTYGVPSVTTGASAPGYTNAFVFGVAAPNAATADYFFEYGTSPSTYTVTTTPTAITTSSSVSVELTPLLPNTTYYYRIGCTNAYGTTYGVELSFTTYANPINAGLTMQPIITVENNVGNTIIIPNQLQYSAKTYLTRDTINSTVITVENPTDFTASFRGLVGELGTENAEVQTISTVTQPTTTSPASFTASSAYILNHYRGDAIKALLYDKAVIEWCATEDGTYAVLATIDFQWTQNITYYQHGVGLSTYYYRVKFKNSLNSIETVYSLKVSPSTSALEATPAAMIDGIRDQLGISADDPVLTNKFFLNAINDARRICDTDFGNGKMKEWRAQYEYPIKMLAGTNYVDLPDDIDYTKTNRALLNARYSTNSVGNSQPIRYIDKKDWNVSSYQRRYTYVSGNVSLGAVTITLQNSGDFPDQGSLMIQAEDYDDSPISISYTSNNKNTNVISGVTGVTRNISDGAQAWAYQTTWYPLTYTVFDQKLWFDSVIPIQLNGINVYIDYYKRLENITDINAEFEEHYYDIYKNYLRFAIKRRRDDSIGEKDPDYERFIRAVNEVQTTVYLGQYMRIT